MQFNIVQQKRGFAEDVFDLFEPSLALNAPEMSKESRNVGLKKGKEVRPLNRTNSAFHHGITENLLVEKGFDELDMTQ